jgi:uncharacterized protein YndB with AHSA1/START domain
VTGQPSDSRASRVIAAPAERVYNAFVDPVALCAWLPPADMTGRIHTFDPQAGYRMSLYYPPTEPMLRGKTSAREDRVDVRFVALEPPRRIVETVTFDTGDPDFRGEMTIVITFEAVHGGTEVTMTFSNLPPGLRPEDNDAGARLSLDQLARRFA